MTIIDNTVCRNWYYHKRFPVIRLHTGCGISRRKSICQPKRGGYNGFLSFPLIGLIQCIWTRQVLRYRESDYVCHFATTLFGLHWTTSLSQLADCMATFPPTNVGRGIRLPTPFVSWQAGKPEYKYYWQMSSFEKEENCRGLSNRDCRKSMERPFQSSGRHHRFFHRLHLQHFLPVDFSVQR